MKILMVLIIGVMVVFAAAGSDEDGRGYPPPDGAYGIWHHSNNAYDNDTGEFFHWDIELFVVVEFPLVSIGMDSNRNGLFTDNEISDFHGDVLELMNQDILYAEMGKSSFYMYYDVQLEKYMLTIKGPGVNQTVDMKRLYATD